MRGDEVRVTKTAHLHMRIQPELKRRLQLQAEARGLSVSTLIDQTIRKLIAEGADQNQEMFNGPHVEATREQTVDNG